MISSLVLLAICAPLVHSSTPKPHLEVNNLQGLLPSSDPLENVRALLTEQIAGLSALLTQLAGVKCSSHSSESAQETLVCSLSIYLHAHGNLSDTWSLRAFLYSIQCPNPTLRALG